VEKWQTTIRLKFKRVPWRIKVGFTYEWKAWLIAYDLFKVTPDGFSKMDYDKQITGLAFGAASWYLMKQGKNVFFSYEQLILALLKASKAENQKLALAMTYASFPEWLKEGTDASKKKDVT
jgi:hypothetical protein